jgi:hypothetical protein
MKFINTDVTSCTIPGTVIDIIVLIVRKEKSSSIFQKYWMNKENRKFTMKESDICKLPSLKVEAINFKDSCIYGGISFFADD